MQKNRVQLVTFISSEEPFDWGLQLEKIVVPFCIYCPAYFYETLLTKPRSAFVEIIETTYQELSGSLQKLDLVYAIAEAKKENLTQFYWLEISFLQAYLSFSFLNTTLLADWLSAVNEALVTFQFPAIEAGVLWGGAYTALFALKAHCRVLDDLLFSPAADPGSIASEINNSFRKLAFQDHQPNLEIAGAIREPVLHLIGDELIFYGFTPLPEIGCRSHVLVQTSESYFLSGFSYRFFHHIGALSIQNFETITDTELLKKLQVKAGDAVIFGAGSLDLENPEFEITEEVVEKYVAYIAYLAQNLNFRAAIAEILPPADLSAFGSEENGMDLSEKTERAQHLNALIQKWAGSYEIPVFSLYQELANAAGILAPEKSDGYKYMASETSQKLFLEFENILKKKHIIKYI